MRKKILTLLLCCALVSGLVPTVNISAYALEPEQEQTLLVCQNGEAVTEAELPISQKITLQADVYPEDFAAQGYQWQIQVPGGIWVDIAGEAQKSINLTYGMVASLLDSSNAVQIRCKLTDDRVGAMLSNEVRVTVDDSRPIPELPLENGTVLREAEAVAAPAQEEVSTPTPDETPADTNTEAPAQDPAEPAETGNADSEPAAPDAEPQTPAAADPADNAADADAASPAPADAADVPASDLNTAGTPADDLNSTGAGLDNSPADVIGNLPAPIPALEQVKNTLQENAAAPADENNEPTGETGEDEKDTYSIIINYVFANGTQAANPWTATVAKGSAYTQTVNSPVVVGYEADKTSVTVDVTNIQEDKTYTVIYSPAEVTFTVKHYQQNVDNDEYTLVDTETRNEFTGDEVGESLAKNYEGFYKLLYDDTVEVAADGSTVVEIRYDRYYYLMNFDLDGGYGVEPIYARYGSTIEVETNSLKKPGYTFDGWDNEIPKTMPDENRTYKAIWKPVEEAKVTIVVWGENPNDEDYSYYENAEIMAKPGEKLTLDDLQEKLICGKEEHTHTSACDISCNHVHNAACYGGTAQENPVDKDITQFVQLTGGTLKNGMVYRVKCDSAVMTRRYDKYYLYYDNTWYLVNSNNISGNALVASEKVNAHNHREFGDNKKDQFWAYNSKLTCSHTHNDSCYACGKLTHTHTSSCYCNTSFMENSKLWKLVRSDEIIVAADGTSIINVYYDRVAFTLHFRKAYSNTDDYGTIQAKWGQNIRNEFKQKCTQAKTSNWSEESDASDPWTSYLDAMPEKDMTFYANTDGRGTSTAYYYVESLNGGDELFYENESTGTGYTVTKEEFIKINGFTFNENRSSKVGEQFNNAKFYYTRNSYSLTFRSDNEDVRVATEKFEAPLGTYKEFRPDYPKSLEKGAYEFAGWYTTAGCYPGSEFKFGTMPASNLILFAKWSPVQHKVTTWLTDEMKIPVNIGATGKNEQTVPHGATALQPAEPENGQYKFVGWFYKENGAEKAFNFSMPVNRDLDLYAKWSSNKLVEYTIKYTLEDGTVIAAETKGSALAGTTKTFEAKTGTALSEGYQTGYFPKTNSHSLTMDIEGGNEYTFVYVPMEKVNYTVRYLEKGTNKVLHEEKKAETSDAVITEKFEQITGYAPDAYQKRLVLSADETANVITFWYVKDDEHAPVQIIHWTQNIAGEDYTEYQSSTNLNGEIGEEYTENALSIPGFVYNATESNASGTLTAEGLVLNLYYDRIEYPYEFRFLEQGTTDNELAKPVTGKARYQAQVTQAAPEISGYTLVSAQNQAINIAIEDPADTAKNNVKIFYYAEKTVDIKYQVVGPNGCGRLSSYQDNSVKVKTGTVEGSVPTAAKGFRFVGWYKDEACTKAVDSSWINQEDKKLTPQRVNDMYQAAVYYAKFERALADLTITKSGWQSIDENQSFIFRIQGTDENTRGIDLKVVVHGDGSVTIKDLPVGNYTVTEETGWSWRYAPSDRSQDINLQSDGTLPFSNSRTKGNWLNGNAFCDNRWMNDTKQESN